MCAFGTFWIWSKPLSTAATRYLEYDMNANTFFDGMICFGCNRVLHYIKLVNRMSCLDRHYRCRLETEGHLVRSIDDLRDHMISSTIHAIGSTAVQSYCMFDSGAIVLSCG